MKDLQQALLEYLETLDEGMMDWEYSVGQAYELFSRVNSLHGEHIKDFLKSAKENEKITLKDIRKLLLDDGFGRTVLTSLLVKAEHPNTFGEYINKLRK